FALNYRLAPRYEFPSAAEDTVNAYRWLLACGYPAENVVIAGDSAGGHLGIGLALALRELRLPPPAGLVMFSPLTDPSLLIGALRDAQRHDPLFTARTARRMLALYGRHGSPDDPRLAVLRGDCHGLPPMLVQAGGAEMLSADAEAFAERVNAAGGRCELQVWPEQIHVFQMLYRWLPEARAALAEAASFITDVTAHAQRPDLAAC
ncbi:MAG: alpha/beta hydrolase fold domain-containing protein, partial [Sciscionella sp.]